MARTKGAKNLPKSKQDIKEWILKVIPKIQRYYEEILSTKEKPDGWTKRNWEYFKANIAAKILKKALDLKSLESKDEIKPVPVNIVYEKPSNIIEIQDDKTKISPKADRGSGE